MPVADASGSVLCPLSSVVRWPVAAIAPQKAQAGITKHSKYKANLPDNEFIASALNY
jgi:hypothetical protein